MWTSVDIAQATTGMIYGNAFEATSVAIDSRRMQPGALFVALKGERMNGHDYVKDALANGAAGALVDTMPEGVKKNASIVMVNDTYKALVDMAVVARKKTGAKLIAVTGSVGKTGTKEALRTALSSAASVYATHGNLNNHIGMPLSLANLPADARYGVFELGMNHAGELSFLTRIVRPDIAVITNVEAVHLEFFPHVDAIADAKAEIMEGLPKDGVVILNRDNRYYPNLLAKARSYGIKNVVTFGEHAEAACRLIRYAPQELGSQVEAMIHGTLVTYRLGTIGRHWAMTSLAALAASVAAGADLANAAASLAHFHEPDGRGRLHQVSLRRGSYMLIDDCYNASPSSVAAGIAKLAELQESLGGKGRKIAALGDMLELGAASGELHTGLLPLLKEHAVDKVYTAGPFMKQLYDLLPSSMQGAHAANATELKAHVQSALTADDVLLLKGSRGSRMDIIRDALLASSQSTLNESKEQADAV